MRINDYIVKETCEHFDFTVDLFDNGALKFARKKKVLIVNLKTYKITSDPYHAAKTIVNPIETTAFKRHRVTNRLFN